MPWLYEQLTGRLRNPEGELIGVGYSGAKEHKNKPDAQAIHNEGPIPCGLYLVGTPHDTLTHGPFVLPLTPDPANEMFGRGNFLVHGDSKVAPGTASEGCIIQARDVRERLNASLDKQLRVVSGLPIPDLDGEISV